MRTHSNGETTWTYSISSGASLEQMLTNDAFALRDTQDEHVKFVREGRVLQPSDLLVNVTFTQTSPFLAEHFKAPPIFVLRQQHVLQPSFTVAKLTTTVSIPLRAHVLCLCAVVCVSYACSRARSRGKLLCARTNCKRRKPPCVGRPLLGYPSRSLAKRVAAPSKVWTHA